MSRMPSGGYPFQEQADEDVAGYLRNSVAQSPLGIYNKVKGAENDAR